MKKDPLNLLVIAAVIVIAVCCLCAGIVGTGYWYFVSRIKSLYQVPTILDSPGIKLGNDSVQKRQFIADTSLGDVTNLQSISAHPDFGDVLAIVSSQGAIFVDSDANVLHSVTFRSSGDDFEMIRVGPNDQYGFINRGSWTSPAMLLDYSGAVLWTFNSPSAVNDMSAGDLDGDHIPEFAVGCNGADGIYLLDINGQKIWNMPGGNIWHVEIADFGDGVNRIVHSDASGAMIVRDKQGKNIGYSSPSGYFSHFSKTNWPASNSRSYFVKGSSSSVELLDESGKAIKVFSAPENGQFAEAYGTVVRLASDSAPYFAAVFCFSSANGSILYVYDPSGTLVYHEVFSEKCSALLAAPVSGENREALLLGGEGRVWAYEMKPEVDP